LLNAKEEGPDMSKTLKEQAFGAACIVLTLMSIVSCSKGDDSPPAPHSPPPPNPRIYEALADLPILKVGDSWKFGDTRYAARFTVQDIEYLTKIRVNDEESVAPERGIFVRIDIILDVRIGLDLHGTAYDWTSPQGDVLTGINPEAATAWEYNPLGRTYVGTGSAEGTILMDIPTKGGRVTVHRGTKFVIQLPSK
jgi:hypothetical protein